MSTIDQNNNQLITALKVYNVLQFLWKWH